MANYLTNETVANANTYVPLMAKIGFAEYVAEKCISAVEISTYGESGETSTLPPMYREDTAKKSRYLMGALLVMYFGINTAPSYDDNGELEDEYIMSVEEYDSWSEGHIFNQIERFKSDVALRDICFDIMQDYRDLEKRVNTAIYSLLQVQNDLLVRFKVMVSMETNPANIEELLAALQKASDEYKEVKDE